MSILIMKTRQLRRENVSITRLAAGLSGIFNRSLLSNFIDKLYSAVYQDFTTNDHTRAVLPPSLGGGQIGLFNISILTPLQHIKKNGFLNYYDACVGYFYFRSYVWVFCVYNYICASPSNQTKKDRGLEFGTQTQLDHI